MRITSVINYTNNVRNKNIRFKSASGELEKLEMLEQKLKAQYSMDLSFRNNYLSSASEDVETAKSSIRSLRSRINSQNDTINSIVNLNKSTQKTLEEFAPNIKKLEKENLQYKQNLEKLSEYRTQRKNKLIQDMNITEADYSKKLNELTQQANGRIAQKTEIRENLYRPKKEGFGSISGFSDLKSKIIKIFGEAVVVEQKTGNNKVPSGILLIGPDKELSFDMAKAAARQYGCEIEVLPSILNDSERFMLLESVIEKAKNLYSQNGKRTVIIMDSIEDFINGSDRNKGILQNIMDKISSVSHATVFALSQNAGGHDQRLTRDGRFEKIIVPETKREDLLSMIKAYIPLDCSNQDFDALAAKIADAQYEGAFSVRQLKNIIESIKGNTLNILIKPAISKEVLESFKKNVSNIR